MPPLKQYTCPICGASVTGLRQFYTHQRTPHNIKCPLNPTRLISSADFTHHVLNSHSTSESKKNSRASEIRAPVKTMDNKYPCAKCGAKFTRLFCYRRHVRDIHAGPPMAYPHIHAIPALLPLFE